VSPQAQQLQTILARISQPRRQAGHLLTLAASGLEPCISPSIPSPKDRFFAWKYAEARTEPLGTVHPLSAFVAVLDGQRAQRSFYCLVATASLYSHPSDECFHRAPLLPYFPCSPSVTRLGADPAPCGNGATLLFRLSENLFGRTARTPKEKIFRTFRKCVAWPWERGTSRRFAQECPEGNPGKYKQEK
jgi:hypothetical protein